MNPYTSLYHLVHSHSLWLPKPKDTWRLVSKPVVGQINGLDTFRGLTIATNGIMVAIEASNGFIRMGHLEFFLKDDQDEETDLIETPKQVNKLKGMEELF